MATIIEQLRDYINLELKDLGYDTNDNSECTWDTGKIAAYEEMLEFLGTLQKPSCDTCTNDKGCVTCKDGELWEGKEVDLEKEIDLQKLKEIRNKYRGISSDKAEQFVNYLTETIMEIEQCKEVSLAISPDTEWAEIDAFLRKNCNGGETVIIRKNAK